MSHAEPTVVSTRRRRPATVTHSEATVDTAGDNSSMIGRMKNKFSRWMNDKFTKRKRAIRDSSDIALFAASPRKIRCVEFL